VPWFSSSVAIGLDQIIQWINDARLSDNELLVVAAALSAVVREVSFARQDGWKLHRLDALGRATARKCPWLRLESRLRYCLEEIACRTHLNGACLVALGDARRVHDRETPIGARGPYDVVLTSPPYGDSRTTVQYGAASSLCLAVVRGLRGLEGVFQPGAEIDRNCLGGASYDKSKREMLGSIKKYWAGARENPYAGKVYDFLLDYDQACESVARSLKDGGKAVIVVGRRLTGGFRLKLDQFTLDRLTLRGLELVSYEERPLRCKQMPREINRFARARDQLQRRQGLVRTMKSETILVLRKR
jgi:hypothetical protein